MAIGPLLPTVPAGAAASSAAQAGQPACHSVARIESSWVSCMVSKMTLAEKVGQMFMFDGYGTTVDDASTASANQAFYGHNISTIRNLIDTYHPGGIIYFTWSNGLKSPSQVVALSNGIQQAALSQSAPVPVLISTDQEEGEIVRIGPPATVFPGNMAVGATNSPQLAYSNAAVTGAELRAMGINVDNAPVVDVNVNQVNTSDGVRSFGDRPGVVASFATSAVTGFQGPGRVSAVAKHFPGLGATTSNPDTGVTISNQTLAQMKTVNFPPFRAAIRSGVGQVMVTSVVDRKIDPSGTPAIISPVFVNGLLRRSLGYQGVVVTDAMTAGALSSFDPAKSAVMAVQAGDDELDYVEQLFGTPNEFATAYNAVMAAVQSGTISQARIVQSDVRLLRLKWQLGLATNPMTNPSGVSSIGTPRHLAVARNTADASITVVRNQDRVLPAHLPKGSKVLLVGFSSIGTPLPTAPFRARGLTTQVAAGGFCPTSQQIAQATSAARQSRLVVVATYNVWYSTPVSGCPTGNTPEIGLVSSLQATHVPVVVVALNTPYDIAYLPGVRTFVATYDDQTVSLNALDAVLVGAVRATGTLPVTIHSATRPSKVLYPAGWGLRT